MARLILSLDNQVLAEYNMTKERYTIGRLPDNDVRIDNPAVSGHHSLIINILNDSFLEDLNSTNGTYVNGKLIKKHALQHGDVITIGHHQLRFSDQATNDTEQDEFEKTMVIPTGQQNAEQLAAAEKAAEAAAQAASNASNDSAGIRLNPEEAAALSSAVQQADEEPAPQPVEDTPVDDAPAATIATDEPAAEPVRHTATTTGIDASSAPSALPLAKLQVLSGAFAAVNSNSPRHSRRSADPAFRLPPSPGERKVITSYTSSPARTATIRS